MLEDLKNKWKTRTISILAKKPGGGGNENGFVKQRSATVKNAYRGPVKWPADLPLQKDIRKFAPPTGHVWRCNSRGAWAGHVAGHERCSSSWELAGSHWHALRNVFRDMWEECLDDNCLPTTSCPIKDLFA